VGEELLLPGGLSTRLLDALRVTGYRPSILDLEELFGKGGGGPRCLVNHLRGLEVAPPALRYDARRADLERRVAAYPVSS
jgi:hypothetical protein